MGQRGQTRRACLKSPFSPRGRRCRIDPGSRTDAGETYVVFGPIEAGSLVLSDDADIVINGIEPGDFAGVGLGVADLNNDEIEDIVLGAWGADPDGKMEAGETYVLFGPMSTGTVEISSEVDITVNGIGSGDFSGRSLAAEDVNGDGSKDLVVAGYIASPAGRTHAGETYVLHGPLAAGSVDLISDADVVIRGIDPQDRSGAGISVGDLNNDGVNDLAIGADSASPGGRTNAGTTFVIFGGTAAVAVPIPGITQWGLVALTALMSAGSLVVLRRWRPTRGDTKTGPVQS